MVTPRNRELESHIAERDAMIRVLQRRVEEKEALYQKALVRNTLAAAKRYCIFHHIEVMVRTHSAQGNFFLLKFDQHWVISLRVRKMSHG